MNDTIRRPAAPDLEQYIRFCSHALMASMRMRLAAEAYEGYDFPIGCRTVAAHAEKLCSMLRSLLPPTELPRADSGLAESLDELGLPLPEFLDKENMNE